MIKLYYAELNDVLDAEVFKRLISFVSINKYEQIKRFHFDIDRKLSLYSEILVRTIAYKELNILNREIIFCRNKYGKPYLKSYPDFHFNLSHTRNAIIVAISDKPIGIDIEKIRVADVKIARRFFTESEVAYIKKARIDMDKRFYEVWTKKEAYIKFMGKGFSIPLNSFDTLDGDISKQILTFEKGEYIISVCNESSNLKCSIAELSESDVESKAMELL